MFVVVVVVRVLRSFWMFSFLWKFKVDFKARKLSLRMEENEEKNVKVLLCVRVIIKRRKKERKIEENRELSWKRKINEGPALNAYIWALKCSLTSLV